MRVIADDLWFPEGPLWVGDGSLLVVEIRRRTLTRVWPDGRKHIVAHLGGGPNGAALGPDGKCCVANQGPVAFVQRADGSWAGAGTHDEYVRGSIQRVDIDSGEFDVIYDSIGEQPIRGPNDLVFDAHGGCWFTDPGKTRHRDADRGSVCCAKADGRSVREVIFPIHRPNGVGLSPDGKTLYVAATRRVGQVRRGAGRHALHQPLLRRRGQRQGVCDAVVCGAAGGDRLAAAGAFLNS